MKQRPTIPLERLMQLLQFADSAFPIGSFAFSDGLETAASEGLVHDAATLAAYAEAILRRTAQTDAVAAMQAARAARANDWDALCAADEALFATKLNREARLLQQRTGRKLIELAAVLLDDPLLQRYRDALLAGRTPGCAPVAQGLLFARCGLPEEALFATVLYGAASRVLNAALRCVRVSHLDTQRILGGLSRQAEALYAEVADLALEEMHSFAPQLDLLASLHEQGAGRLFMN